MFKWLNLKPLRSGAEVANAITIGIPRARDDDRSRKKSIAEGGQGAAHAMFAIKLKFAVLLGFESCKG